MSIDLYSLCPCGSGKKLKFCCSDLIGEMEKIDRMIQGDQTAACASYIDKLLVQHPGRVSLLSRKATVEFEQGRFDDTRQTIDTMLAAEPGNVIALAANALLIAQTAGGREAIAPLQDALERADEIMPPLVHVAMSAVGQALMEDGLCLAGQAHLRLLFLLAPDEARRAFDTMFSVLQDPQVPLLLKEQPLLHPAPDGVAWSQEFDQGVEQSTRGYWRRAEQSFASLVEPSGNHPVVWRNLGLVRLTLADHSGAAEAWRHYGELAPEPTDDVVEMLALGQAYTPNDDEMIDVVKRTFTIRDPEKLDTGLIDDARFARLHVDFSRIPLPADEPRPRALYYVLDRPLPLSGVDLTLEAIPQVLGQAFVFGRETDREARVEVLAPRGPLLEQATQALTHSAGDALGEPAGEEVVDRESVKKRALSWQWKFPEDTPAAVRKQLTAQKVREILFGTWPELPLSELGGQTPAQAAQNPRQHAAVLAAILLLEMGFKSSDFDFNELRSELNLPLAGPIDPTLPENKYLPLIRMSRVEVDKLGDDQLLEGYQRAIAYSAQHALGVLGSELVKRESLADKIDLAQVYANLARMETDLPKAREHFEQGRKLAQSQGQSPALWNVLEFELLLDEENMAAAKEMLSHICHHHKDDSAAIDQLMQILIQRGLIDPHGQAAGLPAESPASVPSGTPPASQSQLWTPESEPAAAGKSKLWIPGMD